MFKHCSLAEFELMRADKQEPGFSVWSPLTGNAQALGTRLVAGVLFPLISIVQNHS